MKKDKIILNNGDYIMMASINKKVNKVIKQLEKKERDKKMKKVYNENRKLKRGEL